MITCVYVELFMRQERIVRNELRAKKLRKTTHTTTDTSGSESHSSEGEKRNDTNSTHDSDHSDYDEICNALEMDSTKPMNGKHIRFDDSADDTPYEDKNRQLEQDMASRSNKDGTLCAHGITSIY